MSGQSRSARRTAAAGRYQRNGKRPFRCNPAGRSARSRENRVSTRAPGPFVPRGKDPAPGRRTERSGADPRRAERRGDLGPRGCTERIPERGRQTGPVRTPPHPTGPRGGAELSHTPPPPPPHPSRSRSAAAVPRGPQEVPPARRAAHPISSAPPTLFMAAARRAPGPRPALPPAAEGRWAVARLYHQFSLLFVCLVGFFFFFPSPFFLLVAEFFLLSFSLPPPPSPPTRAAQRPPPGPAPPAAARRALALPQRRQPPLRAHLPSLRGLRGRAQGGAEERRGGAGQSGSARGMTGRAVLRGHHVRGPCGAWGAVRGSVAWPGPGAWLRWSPWPYT